jgi:hypothetical protein
VRFLVVVTQLRWKKVWRKRRRRCLANYTMSRFGSHIREEVRPIKSEIAIYDFRNFDLCKVYKFIVQNAPKSNILSKIALYHSH